MGKIKTMRPAVYTFDCSGLHDFELVRFAKNGVADVDEVIGTYSSKLWASPAVQVRGGTNAGATAAAASLTTAAS